MESKVNDLILVAGGSGSGKTTLVEWLKESLGPENCVVLAEDSYYVDHPELTPEQLENYNYDHPSAISWEEYIADLHRLLMGRTVLSPVYDFSRHRRTPQVEHVEPRPIIIGDGILVLALEELRAMAVLKLFVETEDDVRFIRRADRDMDLRGRTYKSVRDQWLKTVKPMHLQFCEPTKWHADFTVLRGGKNPAVHEALEAMLRERIRTIQQNHLSRSRAV